MKINLRLITLLCCGALSLALMSSWGSSAKMAQGPFNLVAWDSGRFVQLSWDSDFGVIEHGYNVYRSLKGADSWEKLNEKVLHSSTFVDYSVPRSEIINYRVNSINDQGKEVPSASIIGISTSLADTQPDAASAYDKNIIITDSQLTTSDAMTVTQIQSFLISHGSVLANYSTGGKSAAQHIYDNCQTHGISPLVVLVTLQKEKALITSSTANPNNLAMGWNTSDSSTADFANQIYYGTRQFKLYYNNLGGYGWTVGQAHAVSDGTITAANAATAGLYIYTPWIGAGGGGQSGVGGNYLFWDLWYNTFAFGGPGSTTVCGPQPASFYLRFPLQGATAYSKLINSVMDHSMTSPYATDSNVTSFSGEIGSVGPANQGGYKNVPGIDFFLNAAYRGANSQPAYLFYDGHPGIDYHAGCGTSVYAAVSGTVSYPSSMPGITSANQYHVLLISPDAPNTDYKIYYLHLATHPLWQSFPSCQSQQAIVSAGQHVNAGDLIGKVGDAGVSGSPHLHFEVQRNGTEFLSNVVYGRSIRRRFSEPPLVDRL